VAAHQSLKAATAFRLLAGTSIAANMQLGMRLYGDWSKQFGTMDGQIMDGFPDGNGTWHKKSKAWVTTLYPRFLHRTHRAVAPVPIDQSGRRSGRSTKSYLLNELKCDGTYRPRPHRGGDEAKGGNSGEPAQLSGSSSPYLRARFSVSPPLFCIHHCGVSYVPSPAGAAKVSTKQGEYEMMQTGEA
jgi:hypothetical protein